MSETADTLYTQAVDFARDRVGFTRRRFQECLRVGFVTRDRLLLQLIDGGVIKVASNDRDYFLTTAEGDQ